MFKEGDRVEHTIVNSKGIIEYDDGENVRIKWDDGKMGLLEYNRKVHFNAHNLVKIRN